MSIVVVTARLMTDWPCFVYLASPGLFVLQSVRKGLFWLEFAVTLVFISTIAHTIKRKKEKKELNAPPVFEFGSGCYYDPQTFNAYSDRQTY
jgi:hypothetical protein